MTASPLPGSRSGKRDLRLLLAVLAQTKFIQDNTFAICQLYHNQLSARMSGAKARQIAVIGGTIAAIPLVLGLLKGSPWFAAASATAIFFHGAVAAYHVRKSASGDRRLALALQAALEDEDERKRVAAVHNVTAIGFRYWATKEVLDECPDDSAVKAHLEDARLEMERHVELIQAMRGEPIWKGRDSTLDKLLQRVTLPR